MAGVEACKALKLVREAAILVAGFHELAPNLVEALMVVLQQMAVRLSDPVPPLPQALQYLQCMAPVDCHAHTLLPLSHVASVMLLLTSLS